MARTSAFSRITGIFALLLLILLGTAGCFESGFLPLDSFILITNSSFEKDGVPSLDGWTPSSNDTADVGFSKDVPPDGGSYSLKLRNQWTFPGAISCPVVPRRGMHRYQLSAWGKAVRSGQMFAGGSMILLTRTAGVDSFRQYFHFSDTTWKFASVTEMIASDSVDTIIVRLQGNLDQFSYGDILFDLCNLDISDVVSLKEDR